MAGIFALGPVDLLSAWCAAVCAHPLFAPSLAGATYEPEPSVDGVAPARVALVPIAGSCPAVFVPLPDASLPLAERRVRVDVIADDGPWTPPRPMPPPMP